MHHSAAMRTKKEKIDFYSNVANATVYSFINYKDTGFSPFDPEEPSWDHYQSNPLFQTVAFDIWQAAGRRLKLHARLCIPKEPHYTAIDKHFSSSSEKPAEKKEVLKKTPSKLMKTPAKQPRVDTNISRKKPRLEKPPTSHRNPAIDQSVSQCPYDKIFHVVYAGGEIYVKIDLDGDIKLPENHRIEFSACRTLLTYKSKVPSIYDNVDKIIPRGVDDAFRYLLELEINERKSQTSHDEFEVQKILKLPYPVKKVYHDAGFRPMPTYTVTFTKTYHAFSSFWLLPVN